MAARPEVSLQGGDLRVADAVDWSSPGWGPLSPARRTRVGRSGRPGAGVELRGGSHAERDALRKAGHPMSVRRELDRIPERAGRDRAAAGGAVGGA